MQILFSLTYYTPYSSGLTLYVKRLGEALVKKGFDVTVLTMNFDKHCRSAEIVNGIKIVRVDYLARISKGFISLDWVIKSWQEVKKADAIIINLPQFEGLIPAILGKILGKKVISIYHCEVNLPDGLSHKIIEWFLSLSHFLTLSLSNIVITYTEDFAKHSKLLRHFSSKLQFIYPPILVASIDKRIQKVLNGKIGKVDYVIGVAARLAAEKGIEYLLEAVPEITSLLRLSGEEQSDDSRITSSVNDSGQARMTVKTGIKIIIAGSLSPVGEENYKRKLYDLVEKYKDYVVFLGELKERKMGSFYSLLDVLVLPSINSTEAFGMVQVEAMMMGVPVVATNLPGVRIPIKKTGMGKIVTVKNSKELAEAIVEVLEDKKKYIKDSRFVKDEFSIEKTIEFYQKLLS